MSGIERWSAVAVAVLAISVALFGASRGFPWTSRWTIRLYGFAILGWLLAIVFLAVGSPLYLGPHVGGSMFLVGAAVNSTQDRRRWKARWRKGWIDYLNDDGPKPPAL